MSFASSYEYVSAWADLFSLLLLVLCLSIGGLSPSRKIWGRSLPHNLALMFLIFISILFSAFRYITEAIYLSPGPREFLVGNSVYLARWLYLWSRLTFLSFPEARLFHVARALRNLHIIRFGQSTDRDSDRAGMTEVVIRRGVRHAQKGFGFYWRGYKEAKDVLWERVGIWEVRLVESDLHSDRLDTFGAVEFLNSGPDVMDNVYKKVYDLVMTSVPYRNMLNGESKNETVRGWGSVSHADGNAGTDGIKDGSLDVNFEEFFKKYRGLPVQWRAKNVGAIDERPIGYIARRIAADVCVYISGKGKDRDISTNQVCLFNECIERTVSGLLQKEQEDTNVVIEVH